MNFGENNRSQSERYEERVLLKMFDELLVMIECAGEQFEELHVFFRCEEHQEGFDASLLV